MIISLGFLNIPWTGKLEFLRVCSSTDKGRIILRIFCINFRSNNVNRMYKFLLNCLEPPAKKTKTSEEKLEGQMMQQTWQLYRFTRQSTKFLSLLSPTDFRCFPTDKKKNVNFFFFMVNCSHVDYSGRFLQRINVYKSKLFRPFP